MLALLTMALFLAPVQVTPESFSKAREAQIAIDSDKSVYITYGMGNATYVSVSRDEGSTYGEPIKVAEVGKLSLGMRRGPRIAAHKGVITVTATYGDQGSGRDGDIVAFRSGDRGKTWSGPVKVNDVSGSAREGLHGMGMSPGGSLACVWLDLRSKGTKLYMATSGDGGGTWSKNRLVYASPTGSICECCHPFVAIDANGNYSVMFRNSLNGDRDMYLTQSANGVQFFPAKKLGTGTWKLDACPMDGGSLALTSTGAYEAVWRREGTLYRTSTQKVEVLLDQGRQPWLTVAKGNTYLVWTQGNRILARTPTEQALELSANGDDAMVASAPDGSFVVAAWTEGGIRAKRL